MGGSIFSGRRAGKEECDGGDGLEQIGETRPYPGKLL